MTEKKDKQKIGDIFFGKAGEVFTNARLFLTSKKFAKIISAERKAVEDARAKLVKLHGGEIRAIEESGKMGKESEKKTEMQNSTPLQKKAVPAKKQNLVFVPLSELAKNSTYSKNYINFSARQGKLKAKKIGGVWHTTEEWLAEFTKKSQAKKNQFKEKLSKDHGGNKKFVVPEEPVKILEEQRMKNGWEEKGAAGILEKQDLPLRRITRRVKKFFTKIQNDARKWFSELGEMEGARQSAKLKKAKLSDFWKLDYAKPAAAIIALVLLMAIGNITKADLASLGDQGKKQIYFAYNASVDTVAKIADSVNKGAGKSVAKIKVGKEKFVKIAEDLLQREKIKEFEKNSGLALKGGQNDKTNLVEQNQGGAVLGEEAIGQSASPADKPSDEEGLVLAAATGAAQTNIGDIEVSAYLMDGQNKEIQNGEYDVRFGIYTTDRTEADPYPSDTDKGTRVWEETQKVVVENGLLKTYLGATTPIPANFNFAASNYYIGIRVGEDAEMVPRKRIGAVPLARTAMSVAGQTIGNGAGNIPLSNGTLNTNLNADLLDGQHASAFMPAGTTLTGNYDNYQSWKMQSASTDAGQKITTNKGAIFAGGSGITTSRNLNTLTIALDSTSSPALTGLTLSGLTPNYPVITGVGGVLTTEQYLSVVRGGTGAGSFTQYGVIYGNNAGALQVTAAGAEGQVLIAHTGSAPTWADTAPGAAHNFLSANHPDTTPAAVQRGDLVTGQGVAPTWTRLAKGAANTYLYSNGMDLSWGGITLGTNTSGNYVSSLTGTADQVTVSAATGDIILTLPQSIGAANSPSFAGLTLSGLTPNYPVITGAGGTLATEQYLSVARGGTGAGSFTQYGVIYGNATGTLQATAAGTDGQVLKVSAGGAPYWAPVGEAGSMVWSGLLDPVANLSLAMGTHTTAFTWNAATGANNLLSLADTAGNTGTGYLLDIATAAGSTLKPLHISAAGMEALTILASGNVGIGTTSPTSKLAVVGNLTSGIILGTSYDQAVVLDGALTAAKFDLNDGHINTANQSVTGIRVVLPTSTNNNASGTVTMDGMSLGYGNGTGINQNGAGATIYSGANLLMPALTQSAGTLIANGALITTSSSITSGGTANGVNIAAHGVGAGTLNGVYISAITGSDGAEKALNIGSGWDSVLTVNGNQIINGSGVVQVAAGGTGLTSYTAGDMIYASGATTLNQLAAGAPNNGKVMTVVAGLPVWGTLNGSACTDCVVNDPTAVATQTITPANQDISSLVVRQTTFAVPTHNIFEVTSSNGLSKYFYIDQYGNVSTGGVASQNLTLTPTSDSTALTLVGTNVPTASLEYINSKNTQGTIFNLAYGAPATLAGSLTGQNIDLATNVTANNQSVTGLSITLPTPTNTVGKDYKGIVISGPVGGGINQTVGGTTVFSDLDLTIPPLTQTAGSLTGNGILVTLPTTITTGGTANGLNIAAFGVGNGTIRGINIGNITPGAGSETAIHTGTGWDYAAIFEGGNVGIGTTAPDALLSLSSTGALGFYGRSQIKSSADGYLTFFNNAGTDFTRLAFGGTTSSFPAIAKLGSSLQIIAADNSTNANLLVTGNVGIGTTAPTNMLDVAGGVKIGAGYAGIGLTAPANGLLVQGNVGIGTTSPSSLLNVSGGDFNLTAGYGTEKVTNGSFTGNASDWTLTAGWAYNSNNVWHNANGVTTMSQTPIGGTVAGETYKVTYTVSGWTVGTVTPQVGGVNGVARGANGTYTDYIIATTTGNLIFTPTNTARFTIDDLSVTKVTNGLAISDHGRLGIGTATPNNFIQVTGLINFDNTLGNTYLGFETGLLNTSNQGGNTAVGFQALRSNNTYGGNTALGYQALATSNGAGNTAVGNLALTSSTGNYNTALGNEALRYAGSARDNTAVGSESQRVSTGERNTSLGSGALWNTSGSYNVAVGVGAGDKNSASFDNSVFIGYASGTEITSGDYNTFLGYASGSTTTTGGSNILLGYNIQTPAVDTSNYLSIGNLIFATGGFGTGTTVGTGNVGIGTTSPLSKLHLNGGTGTLSTGLTFGDGDSGLYEVSDDKLIFQTLGSDKLTIQSDGNVGIGTTSPISPLDIHTTGTTNVQFYRTTLVGSMGEAGGAFYLSAESGENLKLTTSGLVAGKDIIFSPGGYESVRFTSAVGAAGNVGIGTTNPNYRLDVGGGSAGYDIRGYDVYTHDGAVTSFSDSRLKSIQGNYARGLDEIMALSPQYYHYKSDNTLGLASSETVIGLMAQDVQKLIPEAVQMSKSGYLTMSQGPIFYAMINAVKQQQGLIVEQQTKNTQQDTQISDVNLKTSQNVETVGQLQKSVD
ncbi:MAG: tail fiber domain-containing protein, partial [Candidatus Moranbacteria bacterium]|nr:tail fiber domain-containing protein [Candidatus Moranbacteria bacterium]